MPKYKIGDLIKTSLNYYLIIDIDEESKNYICITKESCFNHLQLIKRSFAIDNISTHIFHYNNIITIISKIKEGNN